MFFKISAWKIFFLVLLLVLAFYYLKPSDETLRRAYLDSLTQTIQAPIVGENILAGRIQTHYFEAGSGKTVVLLHGAGEGAITWYPVFSAFSQRFRAVAPDVVGYGESDKPAAAYDPDYFSTWLRDFLDAKNIQKASVVGLSQGGAIALHFASRYPDRVEKLVLVDSAGLGTMPADVFLTFTLANTFPNNFLADFANAYLVHNVSLVDSRWTAYGVEVLRMPGGKNVFWQGRGKIAETVSDELLQKITQPTLVVWGAQDRFFPVEYTDRISSKVPKSKRAVLDSAGHLPFFDQREEFAQMVIPFLEKEN